jgi:predicted Zn-dependent protease
MGVRMNQIKLPDGTPAADKQAAQQAINELVQSVRDDITASFPSHKEDVRMLSIYGMFYNGTGDPVKGEEMLTLARTYAPKKQLLGFDLTRSYLMQNKFPEAYATAREIYDLSITCNDAQKWYMLSAAYAGAYKDAKAHVKEKGQTVAFDQDVLGAIVSTGQMSVAIEILLDLKKEKPELASQVDEYIRQILNQANKVAPPVKK